MRNTRKWLKTASILLTASLTLSPITGKAEDVANTTSYDASSEDILTSLNNLGLYMGYDLTKTPNPPVLATTFTMSDNEEKYLINSQYASAVSLIYAFPLMVVPDSFNTIVPESLKDLYTTAYNLLTLLPVDNFSIWSNYDTPSSTLISAVTDVDQKSSTGYMPNMTRQAIFNILTTPDYTYCTDDYTNQTGIKKDCGYLNNQQIVNNILESGTSESDDGAFVNYGADLPNPENLVSSNYNTPLEPLLNADTFLTPLIYNTTELTYGDEDNPYQEDSSGYPTKTQANQAADFVRYLSGQNLLGILPRYDLYQKLLDQSRSSDPATQNNANNVLLDYFAKLRNYTANMSLGVSNLSNIMGKRMVNPATGTSPAFDEYVMATRRVLHPTTTDTADGLQEGGNQWIEEMKTASPTVIQQQMLFLLSEINYQLYLSRMQEERMLATLSAMQLQQANTYRSSITLEGESEE